MLAAWPTRLGLVLDIIGGLLLALELLGPRAEQIEQASRRLAERFHPRRVVALLRAHRRRAVLALMAAGTILAVVFGAYSNGGLALMLVFGLLVVGAEEIVRVTGFGKTWEKDSEVHAFDVWAWGIRVVAVLCLLPVFAVAFLLGAGFLALVLLVVLLMSLVRFSHYLKERHGIRAALPTLGVLFLLTGFVLQFLGTF